MISLTIYFSQLEKIGTSSLSKKYWFQRLKSSMKKLPKILRKLLIVGSSYILNRISRSSMKVLVMLKHKCSNAKMIGVIMRRILCNW